MWQHVGQWVTKCAHVLQQQLTTFIIIMTRVFTIFTETDIQIKLKLLDNSNNANPQVAWANLGRPHLYLY